MRELWKAARYPVSLDGEYQVSNLGRVRTRGRRVRSRWRGEGWRLLQVYDSDDPYLRVAVYINGKRRNVRVHKLVLWTFEGPPKPRQIARHLNDNKHDARLSNLRWGTHRENIEDGLRNGVRRCVGMNDARAMRDEAERLKGNAKRVSILAGRFGVSTNTVFAVLRGARYPEAA